MHAALICWHCHRESNTAARLATTRLQASTRDKALCTFAVAALGLPFKRQAPRELCVVPQCAAAEQRSRAAHNSTRTLQHAALVCHTLREASQTDTDSAGTCTSTWQACCALQLSVWLCVSAAADTHIVDRLFKRPQLLGIGPENWLSFNLRS